MEAYNICCFFFSKEHCSNVQPHFCISYKIYICLVFFVSIACTLLFLCPEEGTGYPENFTISIVRDVSHFCALYYSVDWLDIYILALKMHSFDVI